MEQAPHAQPTQESIEAKITHQHRNDYMVEMSEKIKAQKHLTHRFGHCPQGCRAFNNWPKNTGYCNRMDALQTLAKLGAERKDSIRLLIIGESPPSDGRHILNVICGSQNNLSKKGYAFGLNVVLKKWGFPKGIYSDDILPIDIAWCPKRNSHRKIVKGKKKILKICFKENTIPVLKELQIQNVCCLFALPKIMSNMNRGKPPVKVNTDNHNLREFINALEQEGIVGRNHFYCVNPYLDTG